MKTRTQRNILTPKNINILSQKQLEDFLYSTEKSVYEVFFKSSSEITPPVDIVGRICLTNECETNCNYCLLRKDNIKQRFVLSPNQTDELCYKAMDFGVKELILETGVLNFSRFKIFLELYENVFSKYSFQIYLNLGSQSILSFPNIINLNKYLFLDYSPINEPFRLAINAFNKNNELNDVVHKVEGINFYANIIIDIPGQSFNDIISDIIFIVQQPFRGVKISTFMPHKGTTYSIFDQGCLLTTLKVISLFRLLKPDWDIFIDSTVDELRNKDSMKLCVINGSNKAILDITSETDKSKWFNKVNTLNSIK
ncbi:MAG: hypothetical protein OEV44_04415 [Spirochaetota bacterium]|nr:hypothetical protein [Spirochaetota bacterium]